MAAPAQLAFSIRGPIARADLPGICDRVCRLLAESGGGVVACDVQGIEPDAVAVDALARLQVAARRRGCRVVVRSTSDELRELIALMGLEEVISANE
jgi:ABC-type transporter Mla MlaB component